MVWIGKVSKSIKRYRKEIKGKTRKNRGERKIYVRVIVSLYLYDIITECFE